MSAALAGTDHTLVMDKRIVFVEKTKTDER
jgi:hypothetical protein